jgi:hypothetical protein
MYQLTFFSAVHSTGIAIATVTALGAAPTLSALVAFVLMRERPEKSWYLGTAITILGISFRRYRTWNRIFQREGSSARCARRIWLRSI